jgi:hypothetical protein
MAISVGSLTFDEKWLCKQLRRDLRDDWFPDPLLFSDMIDSGQLAEKIVSNFAQNQGRYQASRSTLFNLPKENFTLRYALEMSLQDRMLYQGAAAYLMPHFDPCLDWKVFSHRYDPNKHATRTLFKPHVEAWKSFIGGVRSSLASDKVLVMTDVSNYYEHVETKLLHETFCQLLPEIKATPETKGQIRECLDRLFEWLSKWSFSAVRGLPQNRDASSFLANVYMIPVDRAVMATGNAYFRYMDDIRIVCPDVHTARRVLKSLIIALRERGLSVNAKKTAILLGSDPQISDHLNELSPAIQALDVAWNTRSRWAILRSLNDLRARTLEIITSGTTQSKDFRLCIRRLVWLASCEDMRVPAEFFSDITRNLIKTLDSAPATTDEFVDYLCAAPLSTFDLQAIGNYLTDPRLRIYTWQDYRLWLVLLERGIRDSFLVDTALSLINGGEDSASRAGASLYLGKFGMPEEKELLARQFKTLSSFLGQRAGIIAVHELPYRPLIKEYVSPWIRTDLKGVYLNLRNTQAGYVASREKPPITRFVDGGDDYAS